MTLHLFALLVCFFILFVAWLCYLYGPIYTLLSPKEGCAP
jgi:hypothetical protein